MLTPDDGIKTRNIYLYRDKNILYLLCFVKPINYFITDKMKMGSYPNIYIKIKTHFCFILFETYLVVLFNFLLFYQMFHLELIPNSLIIRNKLIHPHDLNYLPKNLLLIMRLC